MFRANESGIVEDKPLDQWTPEEMRTELAKWEGTLHEKVNRLLNYFENEARFLRLENERLWKVIEGRK